MTSATTVELPVEHPTWHWWMRKGRLGNRRRIEGDIAVRWLRRHVERNAATITADPIVSLTPDCIEHWHLGAPCLTLSVRLIPGGRRFGLPERLTTSADVVAIPVPDGPIGLEQWSDDVDEITSTCNPGGQCLAFLDAKRLGYVDPKWQDHLLAHGREIAGAR